MTDQNKRGDIKLDVVHFLFGKETFFGGGNSVDNTSLVGETRKRD